MVIEKGDFVEIEYTGKIKDDNIVFDTTDEKIAKEHNLHAHTPYGPVTICIGEKQVLPGIDKHLEKKEENKEYEFDILPEDAFGKKNPQLIQMIPAKKFKEQKIEPMPGLQVNIDAVAGTIKTASGGRVLVDFNHPLAGRELLYKVKVNKKITDDTQKLQGFLKVALGTQYGSSEIKEGAAAIRAKVELPKEAQDELSKKIKAIIPGIKKVNFSIVKEEKK